MGKERVDALLVAKGLASTREEARRLVMAGLVFAADARLQKPGDKVPEEWELTVRGAPHPYASRGGLKLERALAEFPVDLRDRVVVDVGASTGGFTDCALRAGARAVYAVDVGYGQLAWRLRQDPRVRVMERTNFRFAQRERFDPPPDAAVMDVSFISIGKLLPALAGILTPAAPVVALAKPQFEAGPGAVGKGGVVRDPAVHARVLREVWQAAVGAGFTPLGVTHSPIAGGDGNIEFLLWLEAPGSERPAAELAAEAVVRAAHDAVGRGAAGRKRDPDREQG